MGGSGNRAGGGAVSAIAGVAFLAKYTIVVYLGCLAAGLLMTLQRRLFAHWQPWVAVLLAAAIATPNLVWQAEHGWPFLAHGAELAAHKNIPLSPHAFLLQELVTLGPPTAPVWLTGLAAFAFWRRFSDLRWVTIGFVLLIAGMVVARGKPYYPAGAYPLLMAGGAVALEAWLSRVLRSAFAAVIMIGGAVGAPISMPLLPVHSFIVYQRWLGLQPSTGERVKLGALPQYFADMFGWRELAEVVGKAYGFAAGGAERAVFFGRNYGEAAAVDVFGAPWHLPAAIGAHESYFLWGSAGSRRQRDVGVRCAGTGTAEPLRLGRAGRLARQPIWHAGGVRSDPLALPRPRREFAAALAATASL